MKEIKLKSFDGYKYIDGGVCAAFGFRAGGVYAGIKKSPKSDGNDSDIKHKNDLGMIQSDVVCNTAAVYTQNKVKGAPILVTRANLEATGGKARAVIVNSKNANTCNADGEQKAEKMCELTAKMLGCEPQEVVVASTGVIGEILPIEPIEKAMPMLVMSLCVSNNDAAAEAIMTTDTFPKQNAVEFIVGGKVCHLGGMSKGSGMINPNMATTLNFLTTDCAVSVEMLQKALNETVDKTYNCLSIDGDQSTNDMAVLMSSGMAKNEEIASDGADFEAFKQALYIVMMNLTRMLAIDGEGATKLIECNVSGAESEKDARAIAKSVISSSLVKTAIFGEDANWGRILCAIGYADAEFDIKKMFVSISSESGEITVCENGSGVAFSEEKAAEILAQEEIIINISLGNGSGKASAWGCDLTYDYVKINGEYRT
ncbi:MAG: bifunctional glutamate N-acetyltransferase/amino-acid acetyltransferase ArgJ [Ruminococcus sp.]|nr:bifunctional glutamate N-acetyltransferase/amino-acid acetyltransferase ArgJ [Ruminococcus sp.]